MTRISKIILLAGLISFSFSLPPATLTIYSVKGKCKFILSENNQPVVSWIFTCTPELERAADITIIEGSGLAKEINKNHPALNLKNIKVIHLTDQKMIAQMESMQLPLLSLPNLKIKKNFQINSVVKNTALATAQDYNSSRSNKANSVVTNPLYDDKGNAGNNPIYENKNKMGSGGNKDSSMSNQPNSISTAQDYNSSRSNKANSISTAQDYNSSRSNKANSISTAQDYNSSRSNKANCLTIDEGAVFGNSNHIGTGMNFTLGYIVPITKVLSLEAGLGYSFAKFKYDAPSQLPEKYVTLMKKSLRDHSWKIISLQAGPAFQIGQKKLYATLYAKAGVSFIKIPKQFIGAFDEKGNVTEQTGLAKFSGSKTTFSYQAGVRINYNISRAVDIFIHTYYFNTLNDIPYTEKNISKSIGSDGQVNYDKFMTLPFEKKNNNFQAIGLNAGIKIRCF